MKIFLDANILVSVLNKEYPIFTHSSRILSLADHQKFEVFTSPICLAIAFYFSEKKSGNAVARKKIEVLSNKLSIADSNHVAVRKTTNNKQIHDFEDGLEYYSALQSNCKCIITEDTNNFYFSEIEVLNSRDFFLKYLT